MLTCQDPEEVLYRDLVATVVNLNIISIQVQMPP